MRVFQNCIPCVQVSMLYATHRYFAVLCCITWQTNITSVTDVKVVYWCEDALWTPTHCERSHAKWEPAQLSYSHKVNWRQIISEDLFHWFHWHNLHPPTSLIDLHAHSPNISLYALFFHLWWINFKCPNSLTRWLFHSFHIYRSYLIRINKGKTYQRCMCQTQESGPLLILFVL